jgi:tetratricopeptide (TPR) repeat protein
MIASRICPRCGTVVPTAAPQNLCIRCLFDTAADLEAEDPEPKSPPDLNPGSTLQSAPPAVFGDYELLGELGRGGQGVVYRARHRRLGRLVALKTIAPAYLADARAWERFQVEASAASQLDHPNIVPIYEVGERDGFCYYSMKLVEGTTIGELVASGVPDSEACWHAAAISVKVAQAVHHAHQRGVLHRHLKPSNILLDKEHEPHVSDFGLARQLTEDSSLTATQGLIGTPAYLAPEIASAGMRQATVASDVYGLGAILYRLLTGRPPFGGGPIAATLRAVQETEPALPKALNPSVPRDLETICLKCLEKDPGNRYATTQALADDLDRFLREEPILARPIARLERTWRWCRRKPALATAAALGLLLVIVLGIGSPIAAYRINQARKQAQAGQQRASAEAAKSKEVARFLEDMIQGVGPSVARGRDTTMLREILDKTAARVDKELKDQPEVEIELLAILTDAYFELGQYSQMEAIAQQELRASRARFGPEHPTVAAALNQLGIAQERLHNLQAEAALTEALAIRRRTLPEGHPDIGESLRNLAIAISDQSRFAEAEALIRQGLTISRSAFGDRHPQVVKSVHTLANVLWAEGNLPEAEHLFRQALDTKRELWGNEHPSVAGTLGNLALIASHQGRLGEAEQLAFEAFSIQRKLLGDEHPDLASSVGNVVEILGKQAKWDEAEGLLKSLLTPAFKSRPGCVGLLKVRASLLVQRGKWEDAVADFTNALALDPSDHILYASIIPLLAANGQVDSYHEYCRAMLARFGGTREGPIADRVAKACLILPPSDGVLTQACALADVAVTLNANPGGQPWSRFCKELAEYRRSEFASAASWASRALNHPEIAWEEAGARALDLEANPLLAMALFRLGRLEEARAALARGNEVLAADFATLPPGDWADVLYGQALLREAQALLGHDQDPSPPIREEAVNPTNAERETPKH